MTLAGSRAGFLCRPPGEACPVDFHEDPGSFIVTILIGMAGVLIGGFVVGILSGTETTGFNI